MKQMKFFRPTSFLLAILFLNQLFTAEIFSQTKQRPGGNSVKIETRVEIEPPDIPDTNLTPEQIRRLETFRIVWRTIKENYFDQTFSGLDWNKIKAEYEPQVAKLQTDTALHDLLQKMIDRLNRSHFSIIPPEVIVALERARETAKKEEKELGEKLDADETGDGESEDELEEDADGEDYLATYGIGVELRLIDEKFVITRVEPNSAAEKAGLKIGYILKNVNTVSLDALLASVSAAESKKYKKQLPLSVVSFFLNGERDVPVMVEYLDGDDKSQTKIIEREKLSGESVKILANLPDQFVRFEAESLNEDTGYIKFNYFAVTLVDKFCGAVGKFRDKKNLIIDLRGNLGGSIGTLYGIVSLLNDKTIKLGTEITKIGRAERFIKAQKKNFNGNIVVLVDSMSYSAAEMFAAALQENGRATVIGEVSAGEALPSLTTQLPTGAVFLYPVANLETPKGNLLEGRGVQPDLIVGLERKTLLFGVDKQLDSALAYLKIQSVKSEKLDRAVVKSAPPPAKIPPSDAPRPQVKIKQDAKALQIIDNYINEIGGKTNLEKINSYVAAGTAVINQAGSKIYGNIEIYRDSPNKLAEIYQFDSIGKISEVFDGTDFFAQTTILGTDEIAPPQFINERKLFAEFNEILKMRELYPQINYVGSYEREGKPTDLIEVVSNEGLRIILAFDEKTHLLVYRSGIYGDVKYGDYRKVGDILFPFFQTRFGVFELTLTDVLLNEKPDENIFKPEESCFDKK